MAFDAAAFRAAHAHHICECGHTREDHYRDNDGATVACLTRCGCYAYAWRDAGALWAS
jgi:hypothetical protein